LSGPETVVKYSDNQEMQDKITTRAASSIEVEAGAWHIGTETGSLTALGVGSCLVITLYDSRLQIGAMAHAADTHYVERAIEAMLGRMSQLGADRTSIQAKIIGGANMFSDLRCVIGQQNISSAREKLKKERIHLAGEAVGGSIGRSVEFSTAAGIVTIRIKF